MKSCTAPGLPVAIWFEAHNHSELFDFGIVGGFYLGGRDIADGLEQPPIVEPVDPIERGVLDGLHAPPRSAPVDDLDFVEAVGGFGESVVVAVADTADARLKPGLGEALRVFDRHILHAAIAVMDEAGA